ncbi:MAG TPA: DUF2203 family protein [bacterium]|nr:DUF2203 family protein [bacterium]
MASRTGQPIFTIQKANEAVQELRRSLPALRRTLRRIERMEDRLLTLDLICDRTVSPENPDLQDYLSLRLRYHRTISGFQEKLDALATRGYLLRDLEKGVVHFLGRREGHRVLLCWREGEPEIRHWHPLRGHDAPDEEQRHRIKKGEDF